MIKYNIFNYFSFFCVNLSAVGNKLINTCKLYLKIICTGIAVLLN